MIGEFIDGPLWWFSAGFFLIGVTWRVVAIFMRGTKEDLSVPRQSGFPGAVGTVFRRFLPHPEMAGRTRLQLVAGYMFHIGLIALLFWAAPHVEFLRDRVFGFGWTPLPHWAFILAAELAFAGLLILWLHRVLHPVTRLLSDADDHIAAILTFLVMLTGCLALMRSFEGLRLTHLLLAELWLLYFPFSRLMHAFTFVISRSYTGASYGRHGVKA
jgi:nitrate reductase gamma subunit